MSDAKIAENLWSLANGITAFAVLQALTFLYSFGNKDIRPELLNSKAQCVIVPVTLLLAVLYSLAVWWCRWLAARFDKPHERVWNAITWGRIVCILFFTLGSLALDIWIAALATAVGPPA